MSMQHGWGRTTLVVVGALLTVVLGGCKPAAPPAAPGAQAPAAKPAAGAKAGDKLVIVSPHTESIRVEFEQAFARYWQASRGRAVEIEWRQPGGTSEIAKFLDDQFQISFARYWKAHPELGEWSDEVAKNFDNRKVDPDDPKASAVARKARATFLTSDVGVGIDLFFGGGQYDMDRQAQMGHAVDAGLLAKHPDWFTEAVIPQTFSGEVFYDRGGRYYGCCLTAFGICYNPDRVQALADQRPPTRWVHLGEPRFRGQVGIADPTKSGSSNKCFEMLVQQLLAEAVKAAGNPAEPAARQEALNRGWANAMNLIKRIGGNARYVTDSASKVPRDVADGNAIAGMCIDFYGRSEAEESKRRSGGQETLVYLTPVGGSSLSTDPIQLLRGAPQRELAVAFIEFVLSADGQKLWNFRVGAPGGPTKYALRRLPVRKDLYGQEYRQYMTDGGDNPFTPAEEFVYHPEWTAPYFSLIREFIKCLIIDPQNELAAAWEAMDRAGGPEKVPAALAVFDELPFTHAEAAAAAARLGGTTTELEIMQTKREWTNFCRERYQKAAALAKAGR